MRSFEEDDDHVSQADSSENDHDEDAAAEDVDDADADADADVDADAEGEEEDDNDENEEEDTAVADASRRQGSPANAAGDIQRPTVRPEAVTAAVYDIVPTIAAPHSTSINAVTATPDMRWVFSGGSDGYIRKFNWPDTVNGKSMLTVAQRHPFVDSVTKHGVLASYWENEDTPGIAHPVYSLAVHHQALWLLSGLETGGINLQAVRHSEGERIHCLRKHTSAVSVLVLAHDEQSVLSGSWDKAIHDWCLNTGEIKRSFLGSGGQISALEPRPLSSLPVPEISGAVPLLSETLTSNNAVAPLANGAHVNGVERRESNHVENGIADASGSPTNSLFDGAGDKDSLFGEDEEGINGAPSGGAAFGDDDEFSRAIADSLQADAEADAEVDVEMENAGGPVQPPESNGVAMSTAHAKDQVIVNSNNIDQSDPSATASHALPHSENTLSATPNGRALSSAEPPNSSESTFLDASIDGVVRVWDKRQSEPVVRIVPARGVPPWCMNACWSPDGNFIYAGRRNGTVEEYSLHKGLKEPSRTFKFPAGSGAVSAVRAMPNGRHLICASYDILRLYNLNEQPATRHSAVPFLIVPGHRTGVISQLYIDPTCRFMISTAGNRGWEGSSTEVLLGYEIGIGS